MTGRRLRLAVLLIVSCLYWYLVSRLTGAREPWDAATYWTVWYPLSLTIAAMAGYVLGRDGWLGGAVLTFAQLPVMAVTTGLGLLVAVGLLFAAVLAVPAIGIAMLTGRLARSTR